MVIRSFVIILLITTVLFSKDLKKVSLQLSWFDQFQFAGYYIAKEKGFYKDYGLDVDIRAFNFGVNAVDDVDSKKADFAVARETLILDKVAGKDVVALYALFQNSPLVLLSLKNVGINRVEDFKNKRIMTTIDDAGEVSIKAMLQSKNLEFDKLHFVKHTHDIMDLVKGNTDVISAYLSKTPYDLNKMGIGYNIFAPKDYGFDMYSDFLVTNSDFIKTDLNTVRAFKAASLKGWSYAFSHIQEASELIYNKYNSQKLTLDAIRFEGQILKKLAYANNEKLGEIKLEKIERIHDLYNIMGLVSRKIDLHSLVFDEKNLTKLFLSEKENDYAIKEQNLNMCIIPNIKPYSFVENDKFKGYVADYIDLIKKRTSLNFNLIKTSSFEESLEALKNGKCNILASAENIEERNSYAKFTKPFINISLVLTTRDNKTFIDDLSQIKNKKIGIYKYYSFNKKLKELYPDNTFVDLNSENEGLKLVRSGKIYGYIDFILTSWGNIQQSELNRLKISAKLNLSVPLSIAVSKNDEILYSIVNKAVNSISKEENETILQKWLTIEYKKEFDYDLLWKILALFSILLLFVFYKQKLLKDMNSTLKDKVEEKTKELKKINQELEDRVKKEVAENLKKDSLLTRQSKLASMGEMIQNIAHQWRQPLSIISTGASGLKLENDVHGKINEKLLNDTLEQIIHTTNHLSNTMDDFMYFFKPNKDKRVFKLSDAIEKTLTIFNYSVKSKKIEIIKEIEDISIKNFQSEFVQILINIINNSKDAFILSKDVDKMYVFIKVKTLDDKVLIEIKDNAGGIKENIIDKIFEPYFTTKHQYQGTGIGLYMCKQILDKHMNGILDVRNAEYEFNDKKYKGAAFTIILDQ